MGIQQVYSLPEVSSGHGTVTPWWFAFLVGEKASGEEPDYPNPKLFLPALLIIFLILTAVLVVKLKTKTTGHGKFKNPFKNLNLTFAIVMLFFIFLHSITYYIEVPQDFLFPKAPMGFEVVLMLCLFVFCNEKVKEHAVQKCPQVKYFFRKTSFKVHNSIELQEGPILARDIVVENIVVEDIVEEDIVVEDIVVEDIVVEGIVVEDIVVEDIENCSF